MGVPQKHRARPSGNCVGSFQAGIPHRIFPCSPIALPSILSEVGLSAAGQVVSPSGFEVGPRLLKRLGGALDPIQWMEAATPAPLIDVGKDAGADPDRADLNSAIEN